MTEPAYDPALFIAEALRLYRAGQAVIATEYRGKKPVDRDWPNLRNSEDDLRRIFAAPHNLRTYADRSLVAAVESVDRPAVVPPDQEVRDGLHGQS